MSASRTPEEWCRTFGLSFHGEPPRGWKDPHAAGWTVPLPVEEFYRRAARSKLREGYSPHGWMALMDIAHQVEDRERAAGTHWTVLVDKGYGALFADGEQVPLPGPIVSADFGTPPVDQTALLYNRATDPYMIAPRWEPFWIVGIRIAPHPRDTCTLEDRSRSTGRTDIAPVYGAECPTCARPFEQPSGG